MRGPYKIAASTPSDHASPLVNPTGDFLADIIVDADDRTVPIPLSGYYNETVAIVDGLNRDLPRYEIGDLLELLDFVADELERHLRAGTTTPSGRPLVSFMMTEGVHGVVSNARYLVGGGLER